MQGTRRTALVILLLLWVCAASAQTAQLLTTPSSTPTKEELEQFLQTADIISGKRLGTGITNPWKLTLSDGNAQRYGVFKSIDSRRHGLTRTGGGKMEMDFKDSWMFEVAAYELDKILGLDMVPVTVERTYEGEQGALQLWVDDAMTERDRKQKQMKPPDPKYWNHQMFKVRLFDALVYNIDRNLGNLLITPDWKIHMIDHSRTFKNLDKIQYPTDLKQFSLSFVEALRRLDQNMVMQKCGKYLSVYEVKTMMKRRDAILQMFDQLHKQNGDSILYPD